MNGGNSGPQDNSSVPYLEDDYSRASENLRQAIAFLARHQIPPSPMHFRMAYECVSNRNESLRSELQAIAESSQPFQGEDFWSLYCRYFSDGHEILHKLREELLSIILGMQGEFRESCHSLTHYADRLNVFTDVLHKPCPAETLPTEVMSVITDTNNLREQQTRMRDSMDDIVQEMNALRDELRQARQESHTDSLTGLANRRSFDLQLENLASQITGTANTFSLLLIDIDRFKEFNDTYGHIVGDKVLRYVASTLTRCLKGGDTAARYGGEEFAVLLPKTNLDGARAVAEQIRKTINSRNLRDTRSGNDFGKTSVSIGVAQKHGNESPEDLLCRADRALYAAKERGRNRVLVAH